jgi:flagellar basal-body rod protein FlgG
MLRAIDLSRAAMLRQGQYLDTTANNVSSLGVAGFKAVRAALETGETDANPPDPADATGTPAPALTAYLSFNRLFTQGDLHETGVATDMAISGDGFFAVRQADGVEAYTRNGAFRTDSTGRLTDDSGNVLQPGITLPTGTAGLRIAADGTVTAILDGGREQAAGRLQLARFVNANGLLAGANGLFSATAASGPAQVAAPGQNGMGTVRTGVLESANTDITEQMTILMAAQRAYQLNTTAFRNADEMLRLAAQLQSNG